MYSYLEASSLLDFDQTIAKPLFDGVKYPWEVLPKISDFIIALGETLDPNNMKSVAKISGLPSPQRFMTVLI